MDPFNQVLSDAESQISQTESLLRKYQISIDANDLADLNNSVQELVETIHDLSQSIGVVQAEPVKYGLTHHDIENRIGQVGVLNNRLSDIQSQIAATRKDANVAAARAQMQDDEEAEIGGAAGFSQNPALMMELQEQDTVLDSVYHTVSSLREQANVMGQELEDQGYLIEDFDRQVDSAQERIKRGLRKVDWVLKNNRESLSSCCISLLILVLIVLLVLVLIL